jgi:hypothetical protein
MTPMKKKKKKRPWEENALRDITPVKGKVAKKE